MAAQHRGQGGPAGSSLKAKHARDLVDRELLELEKRKLVALSNGGVTLTREGYLEILRRFPRRRS